ncbi:L-lactate dehydrogenase [Rhodothermus marinus]|uniref:L-lactate dehydrogenase n=1 Tax=Rhodothermus marinus (strain ATCC 43812 / DSM 4252 / R-10) TaxID=518766 RepID=D0MCT0_RHOM4|nr:L-lactate dehydrogenase [Rhodothermus marinus]ACY47040.1 L-lactate dehydrogenase [Rhodothermus marinus DSM 4252]
MRQRRVVGLVGTGHVGVAAAYALFIKGLASELILIDKDARRAEGEAMDLMHGQSLVGSMTVRAGTYADLQEAQIVIISAGVAQRPGESRLALLNRNAEVFREIIGELDRHAPGAILIVATNPVDILTYVAQELSQRPAEHIIGTGTLLDTARFRALLGQYYGVDPRSVHAYILGEHGDSEVAIWSQVAIGGQRILDRTVLGRPFDRERMQQIFEEARRAAYAIIERKGYTNTAIGVVIARLVEAILDDEKSVLPVSVRLNGEYGIRVVCLSIPCVIGLQGIEGRVLPELAPDELEGLRRSAEILQQSLRALSL